MNAIDKLREVAQQIEGIQSSVQYNRCDEEAIDGDVADLEALLTDIEKFCDGEDLEEEYFDNIAIMQEMHDENEKE